MDSKTIKHIASLARIELTDKEEGKMSGELSAILGYIDQLNSINTDGVEPLYQTTGLVNSMREDKSRQDFEMNESLNQKLIGQAPKKEGRFIKVKSVLNK
jgi:aspartyl-tRNA(Asn)/glutamyl-tRNA(Gln) amidotransferase subunit C